MHELICLAKNSIKKSTIKPKKIQKDNQYIFQKELLIKLNYINKLNQLIKNIKLIWVFN